MTWLDQPLLALDSETTGTRPDFDRILTLCIGRSSKLGTWVSRTWRINPGVPIPPESTAVHGIGDADVTGWAQPFDALIEIGQWLDAAAANRRPLVLHHAPFDLSLIDAELRRHTGQGIPDGLIVLDTLCLFRRFDWTTGGRALTKLAARHGITFPAHDAEADALASLRLLHILAGLNDLLPLVEPAALHEAQKTWWVLQQDAAEAKALGNGTAFERQDCWPLIPFTDGADS